MKKLFLLSVLSIFALAFNSCEKCDKGKKDFKDKGDDSYYAVDYKTSEYEIIGLDLSEVTELGLWLGDKDDKFSGEFKLWAYYSEDKDSKEVWVEKGTYKMDGMNLDFYISGGTSSNRTGEFIIEDYSKLKLISGGHESAELNFVKKTK